MPYALRIANNVLIETTLMQNAEKLSPHTLFLTTRVQLKPKIVNNSAAQFTYWITPYRVAAEYFTSGRNLEGGNITLSIAPKCKDRGVSNGSTEQTSQPPVPHQV